MKPADTRIATEASNSGVESVRLCQTCGHVNHGPAVQRCERCSLFSGLVTVTESDAKELQRLRRRIILRGRLLVIGLPLAAVLPITLWVVFGLFGVMPDPPRATSEIYADAQPQNWAQGGRTGENSGFTPVSPPVPQQIRWTYSSDGPLLTAPAVVDGRVYVTTQDGRTLALDHENGRQLWEFRSGQFSNSTPAVAGDMVVVAFRKGLIVALDRETGTPRWERDIKSPILASPVVASGIVYLGAGDSNLHALDAATGEHLWSFDTGDWVISSVAYL